MKTKRIKITTSLDDYFLESVDALAKRQEISRNKLIQTALEDYLLKHGSDEWVTESLNRAYGPEGEESRADPVMLRMALASLPKEEW